MSSYPTGIPLNQTDFVDGTAYKASDYYTKLIKPVSDALGYISDFGWSSWKSLNPYLTNGWSNYGSGYGFPAVRRRGIEVQMRGMVTGGAVGDITTAIPAEYWPATNHFFVAICQPSLAARCSVSSSGIVTMVDYYGAGTNGYVGLNYHWTTD